MMLIRVLGILLLLSTAPGWAATYYVAQTGCTGSCTNSNPCTGAGGNNAQNRNFARATIHGGLACLSQGDTLEVDDGVYDEMLSVHGSCPACPIPHGLSPTQHTVVRSTNLYGAVLTPSPANVVAAGGVALLWMDDAQFVTIERFKLDDQLRTNGALEGIWTSAATDNVIFRDLLVANFREFGQNGGGTNNQYINVSFDKIGWDGTQTVCDHHVCANPPGVMCHGYCHAYYPSGDNNLWDGGTHSHIDGWPWHGSSGGFANSIIRNVTVYGHAGTDTGAAMFTGLSGNQFYNNIFHGSNLSILISGSNQTIVHNTFYLSTPVGDGAQGGIRQSGGGGVAATIKNNLFVSLDLTNDWIYVESGSGGNVLVEVGVPPQVAGNVCDAPQPGCSAASPSCFFVSPPSDMKLCAGSPAISAGVSAPGFSPDRAGVPRPQSGYDAGAYEFMTVTPVATALEFVQEPTNTVEDQVITPAVTVRVVDQDGNTFSSTALVTLSIGTNPGGSTLGGDPTKNVAGLTPATFPDLTLNNPGAGYTLVATSPGLAAATSLPFTITTSAPVATALEFVQQPTNTPEDQVITPAVTVRVVNQFGAPFSSTALVTLAIGTNPGGSTLGGDVTQTVAGLTPASFPDLTLNNPGTGYTLVATSPGLVAATSAPFTIPATGAPTQVLVIHALSGHLFP